MAVMSKVLPETMISPETGETMHRGVRPFIVSYKGKSITVELPGYYSEHGDEGVHVGNDMAVADLALRTLKVEAEVVAEGGGRPAEGWRKRLRQK
ncbi:hypothetical protein RHEC894_PC00084 (plasmid) [Rhizobium sp. CIAT894]|uniref:hypothetical protein n=1 Tax=Rhizobium sp. CIAT894 TaxID=2020312 RepID=UPI000A20776F|nr:hypothetical protein [Rhizobium sp. CIAT894]ARM91119.1 hypothetical protein RHEC894_PC00084 [Rhizobium sp. CIAT894]